MSKIVYLNVAVTPFNKELVKEWAIDAGISMTDVINNLIDKERYRRNRRKEQRKNDQEYVKMIKKKLSEKA